MRSGMTHGFVALTLFLAPTPAVSAESGIASVYSHPQSLACGGRFDRSALAAAHRTLPCGTYVRVTNKQNGRSVVVTITDRGPYVKGRIIDLTPATAYAIGMSFGLVPVTVEVLPK